MATTNSQYESRIILLGDCLEVFRPSIGNVVAGFILSFAAATGGVTSIGFAVRLAYLANGVLPIHAEKGPSWIAVALFCLLGVGLIVGGIALAIFSRRLFTQRVEIRVSGYCFRTNKGNEDIPWADIQQIRETILYERPPLLKGPAKLLLPKIASTSYTITTQSGTEHSFNGTTMNNITRFGEILREKAKNYSLAFDTVEEYG